MPNAAFSGCHEIYMGLMSGTSLDGIDAALVAFGPDDANPPLSTLAVHYRAYPPDLKARLQSLCYAERVNTVEYGELDGLLGRYLAQAAHDLITLCGIGRQRIRAIGSHGQTVYHHPAGNLPFTLQIGDPNRIAESTGIMTIADFRRRDVAAGGQGAPLTPAFHRAVFGSNQANRVIVNIGGIANVTCLPAGSDGCVRGFDAGPGNTLLDGWVRRHLDQAYDPNGEWGGSGQVSPVLVEQLLSDPYFARQPPKSTGQEYFSLRWLESHRAGHDLSPVDVQASLLELTARSIADSIRQVQPDTDQVFLCGGGVHNLALVERIRRELRCPVMTTAALGVDPDWVEAVAFAWLARQTLNGLPGNLPAVTGARHPVILGALYPARAESYAE